MTEESGQEGFVLGIVGPTATGKTELSLEAAQTLGGKTAATIIGADAMALYRGMDIGTAKASRKDREIVPHHLIDVLPVTAEASVAAYQRDATRHVSAALRAGKVPIVVGGSGLYVRALLDQLQFPPTDPTVRERLEAEALANGSQRLHERLSRLDPQAGENIAPNNVRRVVRALEVIEITGEPFSATLPKYEYHWPTVQIGLTAPLSVLDERIKVRSQRMFEDGLVEEVRGLVSEGLREGKTAQYATGYQQALAVLDGRLSVEEAWRETAQATSRLARKQLKWFRRDPRIRWVDIEVEDPIAQVRELLSDRDLG